MQAGTGNLWTRLHAGYNVGNDQRNQTATTHVAMRNTVHLNTRMVQTHTHSNGWWCAKQKDC